MMHYQVNVYLLTILNQIQNIYTSNNSPRIEILEKLPTYFARIYVVNDIYDAYLLKNIGDKRIFAHNMQCIMNPYYLRHSLIFLLYAFFTMTVKINASAFIVNRNEGWFRCSPSRFLITHRHVILLSSSIPITVMTVHYCYSHGQTHDITFTATEHIFTRGIILCALRRLCEVLMLFKKLSWE